MIRGRAVMMLGLACGMGAFAVFLARGWLEERNQGGGPAFVQTVPEETVPIIVASRALRFGDELTRETLREIRWPAKSAPAGAFRSIDEILAGDEPRVALRDFEANEVVFKTRVSGFGGRATLSSIIGDDMRAITIRVNDVLGVAGFVLPGDHVDILLTRPEDLLHTSADSANDPRRVTNVLLQRVKVLGVDQTADSRKDQPLVAKAVTLEVTPEQAQTLVLASQVGTLSLSLRSVDGIETPMLQAVSVRDITGVAEQGAGFNIRIVRGMEETLASVDVEGGARRPREKAAPPQVRPSPKPADTPIVKPAEEIAENTGGIPVARVAFRAGAPAAQPGLPNGHR